MVQTTASASINLGTRKWTHYLDGTEYSGKVVWRLAEDSGGNIWVGGYGIGVYCIQ